MAAMTSARRSLMRLQLIKVILSVHGSCCIVHSYLFSQSDTQNLIAWLRPRAMLSVVYWHMEIWYRTHSHSMNETGGVLLPSLDADCNTPRHRNDLALVQTCDGDIRAWSRKVPRAQLCVSISIDQWPFIPAPSHLHPLSRGSRVESHLRLYLSILTLRWLMRAAK